MTDNEKNLIGAILNHKEDAAHILKGIKPEMMSDSVGADIIEVMQELFRMKGKVPNHYPVGKMLGQPEVLKDIQESAFLITVSNAEGMLTTIKSEYIERIYKQKIAESIDAEEMLKVSEHFQKEMDAVKSGTSGTPENMLAYMNGSFLDDLLELNRSKPIPTGLSNYDDALSGIYAGLYVVGAISSLGKTTLMYQIADNMAMSGTPVLYFSLEMSVMELITKSLTRLCTLNALEQGYKDKELDKIINTSLHIRTEGIRTEYERKALEIYKKTIAPNMNIIQGDFGTNINTVRSKVSKFIRENPNKPKPVVFIDYLQIIKPVEDAKSGTKDSIDYNVKELKGISRDFNIPVIVISSFNRANYMLPVSFESFKESGNIEYSADVVIGLQLACLSTEVFNSDTKIKIKRDAIKKAKGEQPRKIEMQLLKSRYGNPSDAFNFDYLSKYDLFLPSKRPEDTVFTVTAETEKGFSPAKSRKRNTKWNGEII